MNISKQLLFALLFLSPLQLSFSDDKISLSAMKTSQIESGIVEYICEYSHNARPHIKIDSLEQLMEYAKVPQEWITYQYNLVMTFQDNQLRIDIDQPASQYFYKPILQSYIHDGSDLTFFSHTEQFRSHRYQSSYREGYKSTIYLPPLALGYDVDTVVQLAGKMVNQNGEKPALNITTVGNTTRVMGTYLSDDTTEVLVHVEWSEEHEGLFDRCVYKQPHMQSFVEIIPTEYQEYDGILYPKMTIARHIIADSYDTLADGDLASEQTLTVVDASFNTTIDESYLAGEDLADYKETIIDREKLRQDKKLSQN